MKLLQRRGFTLLELLVVVLIIGILAAVALPQYQKAVLKSRSVQAITLLNALETAQQAYYLEHGKYATSLDALDIQIDSTLVQNFQYAAAGGYASVTLRPNVHLEWVWVTVGAANTDALPEFR